MKNEESKLKLWQDRLAKNQSAYDAEVSKMDRREALYAGDKSIDPVVSKDTKKETVHVRNICSELIESQVDSGIPAPKVTARRKKDEPKAKLIEDMLRNELDRLPFEALNDQMERTVPIQGGGAILVEWDNTEIGAQTVGELVVSTLHPKQFVPQSGVYSAIEDMDYIILKIPQTKEYLRRRYDVELDSESESEPELKSSGGGDTADDMVTQYIAYYRNDAGGIGLYSWVGDTELEDLDDYQARRLRRCTQCGAAEPLGVEPVGMPVLQDGVSPNPAPMIGLALDAAADATAMQPTRNDKGGKKARACPYCGGTAWAESNEEYEEIYLPITRSDGSVIPGATAAGPTRIPFYKPDIYPVILQKSVSVYGRLLGDSDIDKIATQQNTTNRIETKIIEKLVQSGSYITLPDEASIRVDSDEGKVIRPGNAAAKSLIDVYDMEGKIDADMAYLNQVYEEARQVIGITDSFQGRRDTTATSGKAKEIAVSQSSGRMQSKRVMKDAAYADLFRAMFQFRLAYADEPRPVVAKDMNGESVYDEFNRYDFLEQDAAGAWFWNDQFLFSSDTTSPLANNREAMWQETRMNLQSGAFGDPANPATLILFWTKMEMLHYPGASETKRYLQAEMQRQEAMRQQQMQMQAQQQQMQMQMQQQTELAKLQAKESGRAEQQTPPQPQRTQPEPQQAISPDILNAINARAQSEGG